MDHASHSAAMVRAVRAREVSARVVRARVRVRAVRVRAVEGVGVAAPQSRLFAACETPLRELWLSYACHSPFWCDYRP